MSKEYSFTVMPTVSISRSRFLRKSQHKTSFNMGQIIPIYVDEVLPGDTRSIDMASLVRMSTPIAPIMDNIYMDYFAFFVPNRLVWDNWKEFMGENSVSAGIPLTNYSIPVSSGTSTIVNNTLAAYFGLPVGVPTAVSLLPFRAYYLIYNEWFRNQNIIAPLPVSKGGSGIIVGTPFNVFSDVSSIMVASKLADYFTKSLPYAQKGAAVTIPLGTTAPVVVTNTGSSDYSDPMTPDLTYINAGSSIGAGLQQTLSATAVGDLVTDLSQATAATINQLRYAFQLQKLLEKDALYGSRYWEILASHFGIKAPDASIQRPEYLGGFRQRINVDQVLSTAGYANTSSTTVGAPGANSVTGGKSSLFTKSFVEHGYIFILAVARHDQTYSQGINRMWTRSSRFDFYFPVFANLGAQEVKNKEIYAQGPSVVDSQGRVIDDLLFGYQEAWAEYRYKPSIATGLMNPNVTGSLDFWTLTNKFSALPTLGQTFIEQGRNDIQRALVTGSSGPDFICDFYFEDIAVRPMPMYSIPGLIDHH